MFANVRPTRLGVCESSSALEANSFRMLPKLDSMCQDLPECVSPVPTPHKQQSLVSVRSRQGLSSCPAVRPLAAVALLHSLDTAVVPSLYPKTPEMQLDEFCRCGILLQPQDPTPPIQ